MCEVCVARVDGTTAAGPSAPMNHPRSPPAQVEQLSHAEQSRAAAHPPLARCPPPLPFHRPPGCRATVEARKRRECLAFLVACGLSRSDGTAGCLPPGPLVPGSSHTCLATVATTHSAPAGVLHIPFSPATSVLSTISLSPRTP